MYQQAAKTVKMVSYIKFWINKTNNVKWVMWMYVFYFTENKL